ncbi:carboxymuconolactone decarboxylase family protein [Halobacillus salinus]|uniref:carboxymuconolactone decarboxylase family protein n=1 Tax=Halobacillus salinus TaxID=192814 RepID=UPI0009A6A5B3|nr:carboxymuconolactone decarboxylase family protein [Halobacillus salinus]
MPWVKPIRQHQFKNQFEGQAATVFDRLLANAPDIYESFVPLQQSIKQTSLPNDLREAIITFVSMKNGCEYCTKSHVELLRSYIEEEDLLTWLEHYKDSNMQEEWKAVLQYAERLIAKPVQVTKEDMVRLKEFGYSSEQLVEINQTVAYTSYTNQLSIGLGL